MSHAKRCADKGVANEGREGPKNRQPRSDRHLICRSVMLYARFEDLRNA